MWAACANIHNIVVSARMSLHEYEGEGVVEVVGSVEPMPAVLTTKEDKTEGDSRRAGLVQKAEDRDDLIAKKPLRGERVHRLLERRQELYDPDALSESDEIMCTSESDEDSGDY